MGPLGKLKEWRRGADEGAVRESGALKRVGFEAAFEGFADAVTGPSLGLGDLRHLDGDTGSARKGPHVERLAHGATQADGFDLGALVQSANEQLACYEGDDAFGWLDGFFADRLQESGIQHRAVELKGAWYRDGAGPLVAIGEDGAAHLLEPGICGYRFHDRETGRKRRVGRKHADDFGGRAFYFYCPLPARPLGLRDIVAFMLQGMGKPDAVLICLALLASTLLGMLLPQANQMLFGPVLSSYQASFLPYACVLLFGVVVAQAILNAMKAMLLNGVGRKLALNVESAAMMRLLSLPASFFRDRPAGELAKLMSVFPTVAMMLQSAVLGTVLSAVFSLAYLVQIFSLSPALGAPAVAIVLLNSLVCAASMLAQARLEKGKMQARAKLEGWQASLIENVRTIRATASEEGAFASWAARYAQVVRMDYNGPVALRLVPCIQLAVMLLGTVALYSRAVQVQAETSCFMAVYCAFGMLMGVHLGLSQAAGMLAKAYSQLAVLDSFMNQTPETGEGEGGRIVPSGEIQLRDLRFSYPSANTPVIDGLNLHVRSGEFVAVVGESGCGKSTLMRLLLGFEQAQEGAILFDGHDMAGMDARALRRYFGVVLQDARLFKGDILSNITVSAPWLSEEDAWKAAEAAGIAGDIAALPMGMHTVIAEGGAGFSGGQRQRIAIARALAADPKIILFDEATSALDNVTQAHVMDSLKGLDCTRIVIAHRLSTIRECDRIIVLEGGKIAEEGTYGRLMEKGGVFSRLARRQQ